MKHATRNPQPVAVSESGFTLVELLVVMGILAVVTGLLSMIVYQFLTIPRWGNAQLAVDSDLRNAGLWLIRDGNESISFTPGGTCGTFDTGRGRTYTYALTGNTLNRLDSGTGRTIGVARHVSSVQCPAAAMTGTVAVTLVSSNGDVSVSQTFTVTMRVNE